MKRPVAVWTRYDDGSIDYCLVSPHSPFYAPLVGWWERRKQNKQSPSIHIIGHLFRDRKGAADALVEKHNVEK